MAAGLSTMATLTGSEGRPIPPTAFSARYLNLKSEPVTKPSSATVRVCYDVPVYEATVENYASVKH